MTALVLAACLVSADPAPAGSPPAVVPVPARPEPAKWVEVATARNTPLVLRADQPSAWTGCSDLAQLVPFDDGKGCVFCPPADAEGAFKVWANSATGGVTPIRVTVGKPAPGPTPPGPAPTPTPPVPQPPADPFAAAVRAAYQSDTPADPAGRLAQLKQLAALYSVGADAAADKTLATVAAVVARMKEAAARLAVTGLPAVRRLVAAELAEKFPFAEQPLDDDSRKQLAAEFARIAAALQAAGQ